MDVVGKVFLGQLDHCDAKFSSNERFEWPISTGSGKVVRYESDWRNSHAFGVRR